MNQPRPGVHPTCASGKNCVISVAGGGAFLGPYSKPFCLPCTLKRAAEREQKKPSP